MRILTAGPDDPVPHTVTILAICEFRPWPFEHDTVDLNPSMVGTVSGTTMANSSVSWASHRSFNLLTEHGWDRIAVFTDGRCAVMHKDHKFLVGDVLVIAVA